MRTSSGDKGASALGMALEPLGRPGGRLATGCLVFLAAALALLAAFSASERTTWSSRTGKARRSLVLTSAKLKKAREGTECWKMEEKKRSTPKVVLPALVTT